MVEPNEETNGPGDGEKGDEEKADWKRIAKRPISWLIGALIIGLGTGIANIGQGFVRSAFSTVKGWIVHEKPPNLLTATATKVDPWDRCSGGDGVVYLKPTSIADARRQVLQQEKQTQASEEPSKFDTMHHAAPANYTIVQLHLQGTTADAVTIEGIRVQLLERHPAPRGLRVTTWAACGDTNMNRFAANLDSQRPALKFKSGINSYGQQRIRGLPVRVTSSDPEEVVIVAYTTKGAFKFKLSVDWQSGDRSGVKEVGDPHGAPFEVASGYQSSQYTIDESNEARLMHVRPQEGDPLEETAP
ncbi:hypothetical protein QA942_23270 [Streptomyces sp. B21-106]|uniref:hypothetical protein n=1 Tax=Streptomyces sp. B21-106 TaxID=3039418 RepID=UPI002FF39826